MVCVRTKKDGAQSETKDAFLSSKETHGHITQPHWVCADLGLDRLCVDGPGRLLSRLQVLLHCMLGRELADRGIPQHWSETNYSKYTPLLSKPFLRMSKALLRN